MPLLKNILSFSLLVTPLIIIHELGHYWAARLFGVKVESFSIGFGAPLWKRTDRNGTEWRISALPLGGYVKMLNGPHSRSGSIERISPYIQSQSLDQKGSIEKIIIALAGPFMNYLFSFLLLSLLFANVGNPVYDTSVGKIESTSLAYKSGIRESDKIHKVNNQKVHYFSEIDSILQKAPSKTELSIQLSSSTGQPREVVLKPLAQKTSWKEELGLLCRSEPSEYKVLQWRDSLLKSLDKINPQNFLQNMKLSSFQGPVGIAQSASKVMGMGWVHVAYFMCALSIGLGFFNLLPLPILDGGVALIALFEGIFRRKISPHLQQIIQVLSFILVGLFFISISWKDLSKTALGKKWNSHHAQKTKL